MGKASSSKKVARAARTAGRPGARRNLTWPAVIGLVVVLGVVGILLSLGGGDDDDGGGGPPRPNEDHWHAAYGVRICYDWVTPFEDKAGDREGIHTHGDGLMHIHPFLTRVSGKNANIAAFARDVGLGISDTKVSGPGFETKKNGDKCGSKAGEWKLVTWDSVTAKPKTRLQNFETWAPPDQSVWVLAFVPKGTTVPLPPSISQLQDPTAAEEGRQLQSTTSTSEAGDSSSTTTSAPSDSSSTTSSSAPAESTSTTSSPP
jgi:hypothetical protein